MIVRDKAVTLERANEISNRFMKVLRQELRRCYKDFEDDPAEHCYLLLHVASNFLSKIILIIHSYGKGIYDMPNLDINYLHKIIRLCADEYIKSNIKESE